MSDDGFKIHVDAKPMLDFVLQTSMDHIKKYGDLVPRAMAMAPDGQQSIVAVHGESSLEILEDLFKGLRQLARDGKCKATCIGYDIRLRQPNGAAVDAICIDIDHQDAKPMRLMVPYRRRWFGWWTTFYGIGEGEPQPRIFGTDA